MVRIAEYPVKFILYIAVIVLLNIAGLTLFLRFDLTAHKIYSLSEASRQAVSTLSEPLSIKVFFSSNLPAPHNNTEKYLRDLLEEYAAFGGRYFNYQFHSVTPAETDRTASAEENRQKAREYGISPIQIRVMENDELTFKNAFMGLVMIHGDLIEKIDAITTTDGLEYQVTTAIRKLNNKVSALLGIREKIRVTLFLSGSLETIAPLIGLNGLPDLPDAIGRTISDLNARNMGILEFQTRDFRDTQELEQVARTHDLMTLKWPDIPENNILSGQGTAGLILSYQDKTVAVPLLSALELPIIGTTYQLADPERLGDDLMAIIEKMIGVNKDIGFLADHGTLTLGPDRMAMMQGMPGGGMQVFNDLLSARYDVRPVSLEEGPVPEGLNCLIIARPTQPFSDYELLQIDQALMRGTHLAFFGDAFQELMPQGGMGMPQYIPIDTGLEKLLAHYGVAIRPAYVLDKSAYKHQSREGGEQAIYFAPMITEQQINTTVPYMRNIKGLITMQISPLDILSDAIDPAQVTATRLLASSDESWLMENQINLNPMFITPPETDLKSYDLAYMLEGTFTSYFRGKPIPVTEIGETDISDGSGSPDEIPGESDPAMPEAGTPEKAFDGLTPENRILETSRPSKIFVLGCTQMLQDNMLDPEGRTTNATFILNVLDHLNGEDAIAAMRSKQQTLNPLQPTTPFFRGMVKILTIAGLPALIILFGLGVLILRNVRKKKIAALFMQ